MITYPQVIRTNLSAILKELLRALGERKWRDRQSACVGLADVLRGKGWDELGPHLEELWTMADRFVFSWGLSDAVATVAAPLFERLKRFLFFFF